MKKVLFTLLWLCIWSGFTAAQGTRSLEYNQALLIGNTLSQVPAGKVWKVSSIYGNARICIPCTPEHVNNSWCGGRYVAFVGASFTVNGISVFSERNYDGRNYNEVRVYSDNNCLNLYANGSVASYGGYNYNNIEPNYNILPMWLPAGTTVQTSSPNIVLSVLEFNVNP